MGTTVRPVIWILALLAGVSTLLLVLSGQSPNTPSSPARVYSYEGYDYPSSLPMTYPDDVHLIIDPNSVHYNVPGPAGDAAWRTVFPRNNEHGIVRLGPKGRAFGLGMFHELKCLNVIRLAVQSVHDKEQPSYLETNKPRVQHCMDYLRHTVLCRADTTLQNLENEIFITESSNTYVCKDWTAVYDVVNNNGTNREKVSSSR